MGRSEFFFFNKHPIKDNNSHYYANTYLWIIIQSFLYPHLQMLKMWFSAFFFLDGIDLRKALHYKLPQCPFFPFPMPGLHPCSLLLPNQHSLKMFQKIEM